MSKDGLELRGGDSVWEVLRFDRVYEEQDGGAILVLRDGGVAAALAIYPPNFAMFAEEAIDALLDVRLRPELNKLTFPVAVYVRARKPDLAPWFERRQQRRVERERASVLRQLGLEQDTRLATELHTRDVVEREMYAVVPYTAAGEEEAWQEHLLGEGEGRRGRRKRRAEATEAPETTVQITPQMQRILASRVEDVARVLRRIGCYVVRLGVLGLYQWFFEVYNPDRAQKQPLTAESILGLTAPIATVAPARIAQEGSDE